MTREIAKRLIRILLAYAVAVSVGSIALTLYTVLSNIDEYRATLWSSILLITLKSIWILATFAGFPSACAVALGEYRRITSWRYYLLAGALIGAGFSSLVIPEGRFPWQGPVVGAIVGLIYWRLEGWRAGESAERRTLAAALLLIGVLVLLAAMVTFMFIRPYGR